MNNGNARLWPAVLLSFFAALILTLIPLPGWIQPWRPSWIALVVVYWLIFEPRRIGLFTAWIAGLALDTLSGTLLGQHALALIVMGFVALQFHLRVRVFPIGQQTATVFMLIALYQFMLFWVDGVSGDHGGDWRRWLSVVSSAAVWPLLAGTMYRLRRTGDSAGAV